MSDYEYVHDTSAPLAIGATGMKSITRNIRIILETFACSVPLDRNFAHKAKMLDSPAPGYSARLASEMMDSLEKYEPRIRVRKIEFVFPDRENQLMQGHVIPKVIFSLKDGVKP